MSFPRYSAYKDSGFEAVPEIPQRWLPTRLRFLLRDGYEGIKIGPFGSQLTSDMLDDAGDYKVYGQEHVIANDFDRGSRYIDRAKFEELTAYEIKSGDLLVTMMGTSGRCDVVPTKMVPGIMDSHLLRIRVTPSVRPEFVRLLIDESAYVGIQIDLAGKGSIMHGLNSTIVKNLLLFVPPDDEQAQILTFLDHETAKIDALVAEQERLIELLKEKRQAVISHAVTKGLDPSVPMKNSGVEWLGLVPAHWEVRQVRSIASFLTSGPRGWSERVGEEGSLFVQSGDLTDDLSIALSQAKRVAVENDAEAARTRLIAGDVVVCITGAKTGNVAVCDVVEEDAYINQHLCLIRPKADVLPRFLGVFLKSDAGQRYFGIAQYGLKQGLSLENVKATPLVVPPISEQEALVAAVTHASHQMDQLIGEAVLSIELLRERRSALISAAVTGQIDLRNGVF